ncbi:ABC transporter ATP-binding protein [Plantactinospora sp. WMMC1484]|uniref:ABC transporter ATP-binding protein n=1 Tax=Plantactinospora sp. WMMC1484 TaxID=3404122 RepID=UPI003BF56263
MKDAVDALRVMLGIMWETNRKIFVGHLFVTMANVVAALVLAFGLRPLINGTYYQDRGQIIVGGVTCVLALCVLIYSPVAQRAFMARSIEVLIMVMQRRIMRITVKSPSLDHFENSVYWDRLQILRRNFGELLMGMMGVFVTPIILVQLLIASVTLFRLDWRLFFLPLMTLPVVWLHAVAQRIQNESEEAVSATRRSVSEMFKLATSAQSGKEVRVYGLGPDLVRRHGEFADSAMRRKERAIATAVGIKSLGYLLLAAAYTSAVYIIIQAAVAGRRSPGDVALTLALAAVLIAAAMVSSDFSSLVARAVAVAKSYEHLLRDLGLRARPRPLDDAPARVNDGLVLENVGFSYAGSDRFAIDDVSVRLPAGAVVALVGENGAGKTTLVKLLSQMYAPTSGRILLDGRDITEFEVERYRRRLSASFQDFVRFELKVREAVGIGDLERTDVDEVVRGALDKARCGFVNELPEGWDTQLGKEWDGGVELSGGQWQRLAIARSFMREQALLVIFDEPTAALDPQSEYEIFQQVADEARAGGSDGRMTLLVSHRFSTVRMADLILVMEGGRLVESGSHEELMASGGLYAELYRLQAKAYVA